MLDLPLYMFIFPASQLRHAANEADPMFGLYFPLGQAMHEASVEEPGVGLYFPTLHKRHSRVRPPPLYFPGSQLAQVRES